jgi:hypothetical protein
MLIKIYKHAVDHAEAVKYWAIYPKENEGRKSMRAQKCTAIASSGP